MQRLPELDLDSPAWILSYQLFDTNFLNIIWGSFWQKFRSKFLPMRPEQLNFHLWCRFFSGFDKINNFQQQKQQVLFLSNMTPKVLPTYRGVPNIMPLPAQCPPADAKSKNSANELLLRCTAFNTSKTWFKELKEQKKRFRKKKSLMPPPFEETFFSKNSYKHVFLRCTTFDSSKTWFEELKK